MAQWGSLEAARKWAKDRGADVYAIVSSSGIVLDVRKLAQAEQIAANNPGSSLVRLLGTAAPQAQGEQQMGNIAELRAGLEALHVMQLFGAARAVGYSFRNGAKKAEVIDGLIAAGKGAAALAQAMHHAIPEPKPSATMEEEDDPAPIPSAKPNPADAIRDAIRAIAGESVNEERVREIAEDVAERSLRAAMEEGAIGNSAPTYLRIEIPALPPVQFDRRTHKQLPRVLRRAQARHNILLVGPAGSGKTTVARDVAEALSLPFYAISAIAFAHDLLGYKNANGDYVRTLFREAFENGGVFLLDDCFGSAPDALLALNMSLANSHCAFPDGMISRHANFVCICGDNSDGSGATMQFAGRQRQDGAFLDRFANIPWEIDEEIEEQMSGGNVAWLAAVRAVRRFAAEKGIQDVCATPRAVIRGAEALSLGEPGNEVLETELLRGALRTMRSQIEAIPEVRKFLDLTEESPF